MFFSFLFFDTVRRCKSIFIGIKISLFEKLREIRDENMNVYEMFKRLYVISLFSRGLQILRSVPPSDRYAVIRCGSCATTARVPRGPQFARFLISLFSALHQSFRRHIIIIINPSQFARIIFIYTYRCTRRVSKEFAASL